MLRRSIVLTAVLAAAAFAAGCGSDSKSSSSSTPATSTPAASTPATSTPAASNPVTSSPAVQAAVDACKQTIESNPDVKANVKADLEGICDKAATGDANAVKQATQQVCLKIVESSGLPSAAQDAAKAACNSVGG